MVQFWAHKEMVFVHCCVLQFAYCAVVMAEYFYAMEVCCETVHLHRIKILERCFESDFAAWRCKTAASKESALWPTDVINIFVQGNICTVISRPTAQLGW